MASSLEKKVPPHSSTPRLISKVLHVGDSVRIGRKPTCEVMVKCPFISSIHCRIEVVGSKETTLTGENRLSFKENKNGDDLHFFVSDLSSNGTWLLKANLKTSDAANSRRMLVGKDLRHAKKLVAKAKMEILPEDCILLLSPSHKNCMEYRFVVKVKGSECTLEQLPSTYGGDTKSASMEGSCVSSKLESAAVYKRYTLTTVGGGDANKHGEDVTSDCSTKQSIEYPLVGSARTTSSSEVEKERCPNCWKLFPIHELPLHSPICQESVAERNRLISSSHLEAAEEEEEEVSRKPSSDKRSASTDCKEMCPHCLNYFPLEVLISHAETCSLASWGGSGHSSRSSSSAESAKVAPTGWASVDEESSVAAAPVSLLRDTSLEPCPYCSDLLPVIELVTHCATCKSTSASISDATASRAGLSSTRDELSADGAGPTPTKRPRYTLDTFERSGERSALPSSMEAAGSSLEKKREDGSESSSVSGEYVAGGKLRSLSFTDGVDELEQCVHCLKNFPISELISHAAACSSADKEKGAEEHCQHCLKVFPLSELVAHALNCSQRKDVGSLYSDDGVIGDEEMWGEPFERCMHCFKDFPLSKMVEHSRRCRGDMLGSRERFKNFLPSVHDLDPMSLAVLNEKQMRAVEYVMEISKKESESVYTQLRDRVVGLGYSERDLEKTLQWIRRDAPIIIHLKLDRVLKFLVDDTHYRNLFETHTGSGSLDKTARSSWEDRLFNNLYRGSAPVDRVKYGVLNIVGDPRGVSCCSGYGDSFLQLKKVRLRTTFASEDTSSSRVVLSCCEHYGNVLYRYNNSELKAILEVATRKVEFLRSDMISQYKEIQIHGPLCLSENVDCIVVNERHGADEAMRDLLDRFVSKNKCNLIWMEKADRVDYPSFTHAPAAAHFPSIIPPPVPVFASLPIPPAPPPTRRRRKRRRRDREWY